MRRQALLALLLMVPFVAGCATDSGRTLPALPTAVTTSAETNGNQSQGIGNFAVDTTGWTAGGVIPDLYTARGGAVSPPIRWTTVPADAVELALVFRDVDADVTRGDQAVLWIVGGLDPALLGFAEGTIPPTADLYLASTPDYDYFGPDTPPGETHTFTLTLYALRAPLAVDRLLPAADVVAAIEAQSFTNASYSGIMIGR